MARVSALAALGLRPSAVLREPSMCEKDSINPKSNVSGSAPGPGPGAGHRSTGPRPAPRGRRTLQARAPGPEGRARGTDPILLDDNVCRSLARAGVTVSDATAPNHSSTARAFAIGQPGTLSGLPGRLRCASARDTTWRHSDMGREAARDRNLYLPFGFARAHETA